MTGGAQWKHSVAHVVGVRGGHLREHQMGGKTCGEHTVGSMGEETQRRSHGGGQGSCAGEIT